MQRVLGIVNLHHSISLSALTRRRSLASVGFLARYCFIDFVLSNFANSNINEIGVLIKEYPRSLFRHLGLADKEWSLNAKTGGISLLYNEQYANHGYYNHDINNLIENYWFLRSSKADYVVIAPAHILLRMDYRDMIREHIESKADVTILAQEVSALEQKDVDCDCLRVDPNQRVLSIEENHFNEGNSLVSLETVVMKRETLIDLIRTTTQISTFFSLRDGLNALCKDWMIRAYTRKGYVRFIDSIQQYVRCSLELIDPERASELFSANWPIYTRTYDTPPARYEETADVKESYVANGTIIRGTVHHSIIGRDVLIEEGAVVKNCILQSHTRIAKGAHLEYVVVDKEAIISEVKEIIGKENQPVIIKQEEVI